jgi:hypothetical protein
MSCPHYPRHDTKPWRNICKRGHTGFCITPRGWEAAARSLFRAGGAFRSSRPSRLADPSSGQNMARWKQNQEWTIEEVETLRALAGTMPLAMIAKKLQRTIGAVLVKAFEEKLSIVESPNGTCGSSDTVLSSSPAKAAGAQAADLGGLGRERSLVYRPRGTGVQARSAGCRNTFA